MERAYDRVATGKRIEVEMMIDRWTTHGNIDERDIYSCIDSFWRIPVVKQSARVQSRTSRGGTSVLYDSADDNCY